MSDAASLGGRSSLALADSPVSRIAPGQTPPAPLRSRSRQAGRLAPRTRPSIRIIWWVVAGAPSSDPGDYIRALSRLATSLPLSETRRPPARGHPQHWNTAIPGARPVTSAAKWHLPGIAKDEKGEARRAGPGGPAIRTARASVCHPVVALGRQGIVAELKRGGPTSLKPSAEDTHVRESPNTPGQLSQLGAAVPGDGIWMSSTRTPARRPST